MSFAVVIAQEAPESDPVLYRGNILRSMDKAKLAGFDAVEIHIRNPDGLDRDALIKYCEINSLSISALATGMAKRIDGLTLIHDDEYIRTLAVERILGFIEFAFPFSAGIIIGSMRGVIPDNVCNKKYYNRFYACMSEILNLAELLNVPIFLEVINRYENNYLNTAEEALEIIRLLDSNMLKVHLDTFHMNIEETDMVKAISICKENLGYIHLADNTRYYPGSGTINFKKLFDATKNIDYKGYYSLECLTHGNPDKTVQLAMEHLRNI